MIISYMRSSSYSNYSFCQMQYYINYVLGVQRESSKKALIGTTVHKVLECLASIKKQFDNNKSKTINFSDEIGTIKNVKLEDLLKLHELSNEEVDVINKTRINKSTYLDDCKLSYGHIRYGVDLVEEIIQLAQNHYEKSDWSPVDYKDITNYVWMVLGHNNGLFDPRKRRIVSTEQHFDFILDYDWAILNKNKPGKLGIKGTIDLITELDDGIIEILDWKCGKRVDWSSQKDNDIKTYDKLSQDFQLMLYYYAAKKLYPNAKQILVTIFWIRHGGPFTLCFDEETIIQTEKKIQKRFEEIKDCKYPTMQDSTQTNFKCKYICDYFKMPSPDGKTNLCRFIHDEIHQIGIDQTTAQHTNQGFKIGYYEAPGEA